MYFKKIETERLYLSPTSVDDAVKYTEWLNNHEISKYLGGTSRIYTLEGEKKWIEETNQNGYVFAIVSKDNDKLIGNCGFVSLDKLMGKAEIGIFIGDNDYLGKGYGTEILKALVKYGFDHLFLNNIMLKVFSFNERAIKSYQKVGFKEFGRRHKCYNIENTWYDEIYMEILREDFYKE